MSISCIDERKSDMHMHVLDICLYVHGFLLLLSNAKIIKSNYGRTYGKILSSYISASYMLESPESNSSLDNESCHCNHWSYAEVF